MILGIRETLDNLNKCRWELNYGIVVLADNIYGYCIFAEQVDNQIWFCIDKEPLIPNSYYYTSTSLKDCCEFLQKEVGLGKFYYY